MRLGRRVSASLALALVGLTSLPLAAGATFHLVALREVYPGSTSNPAAQYVELQAYAAGQNFVEGHQVRFYDAAGAPVANASFPRDLDNGQNQMTLLVGTPAVESQFGVSPDATMTAGSLDPAGGAVCWETLDCASWGNFSGSLPSPAGSPAAPSGIPDGMALRRTISPGCPTLLEAGDDHDSSSLDFSAVFPEPRPNSAIPSEHACDGTTAAAGKTAGAPGAPQTILARVPRKRTRDRTPTFRFYADEAGAGFECKLDGKPFRPCRSPFTTHRLRVGRHVFRVRAHNAAGAGDPSPALYSFSLLGKR